MKNKYLISICIPTHNRDKLLDATLNSLINQDLDNDVEIVVLDSASTDNTKGVVKKYLRYHKHINYQYNKIKQGIDLDMSLSVEYARGEFCWLVSDDDPPTKNAISILRHHLKSDHEIYLCNRVVCDRHLNPIKTKFWLKCDDKETFVLKDPNELNRYLDNCNEFGAIFSYMCALAFKREMWLKTKYDKNFTNSGYGHVTRIFDMIKNGAVLEYIKKPMLLNRSFNDSFMSMGILKRYLLDINGYINLSKRCLGEYEEFLQKKFLKVMITEHPWHQLIKIRRHVSDENQWKEIKLKLLYCGYRKIHIRLAEILSFNNKLVDLLVYVRYKYNSSFFHRLTFSIKKFLKL